MVTEFSSGLSIKVRTGAISVAQRAAILARFNGDIRAGIEILPVTHSHFRAAAALADRHETGLRGGDALHLAIVASHGATLHTLDRRLAITGEELGIAAVLHG